ncbi:unnamed protein product [Moneuplotes crassus]|uniref:Uncharacterized protein n=1 Tax=Euplotes crassus TaxID=5936 RepID=A0AAD1UNP3_EUPCR|nr:unnamed protein product [Moneuplotes crassus]
MKITLKNNQKRNRKRKKQSDSNFLFNLKTFKPTSKKMPARKSIRLKSKRNNTRNLHRILSKRASCNTMRSIETIIPKDNLPSLNDPSFLEIIRRKASRIKGLGEIPKKRIVNVSSTISRANNLQEPCKTFLSRSMNVSNSNLEINELNKDLKIIKKTPVVRKKIQNFLRFDPSPIILPSPSNHHKSCETGGYEPNHKGMFILKHLNYIKKSKKVNQAIRPIRLKKNPQSITYRAISIKNIKYSSLQKYSI